MEIQDILSLIQAVDQHKLTEFKLDNGDIKLSFKKEAMQIVSVNSPVQATAGPVASTAVSGAVMMPEAAQETDVMSSDKIVSSPLVGTFYNAASPESEPFVKVGDSVKKGQVLGIIEAMKLMNEIECEFDGVVEAVLVNNEDVVEYGQPLFRIR